VGIIQPMSDGVGHMKVIFQGKQGSGKTYTAVTLACGVHRQFKCEQPILCFDTEGGLRFHRARMQEITGQAPLAVASRRIADLMAAVREAEQAGVEVMLIDSVTHIWQGIQESYKAGLAQRLGRTPETVHLSIDDIGKIKDLWSPFARWFVEAQMHVIVCGRLGYDWDMVENDHGQSQLQKVGTKAKAEGEFGYESDLAIEMELIQDEHPLFKKAVEAGRCKPDAGSVSMATCVKDRWDLLMGKREFNPAFDFFQPVVSRLRPREAPPIDTDPGVADLSDDGRARWKVEKAIVLENIELAFARALPGTTGKDRTAKLDLFDAMFGTLSWEEIKRFPLPLLKDYMPHVREATDIIREDRDKMKQVIERAKAVRAELHPAPAPDPEPAETPAEAKADAEMDAQINAALGNHAPGTGPAPLASEPEPASDAATPRGQQDLPLEGRTSGQTDDNRSEPAAAEEPAVVGHASDGNPAPSSTGLKG